LQNAAMELSLAAGCLGDYAGELVLQSVEKTGTPAIGEAGAVEIFRSNPRWGLSLAFEYAYSQMVKWSEGDAREYYLALAEEAEGKAQAARERIETN
jgi:hypothetical protein